MKATKVSIDDFIANIPNGFEFDRLGKRKWRRDVVAIHSLEELSDTLGSDISVGGSDEFYVETDDQDDSRFCDFLRMLERIDNEIFAAIEKANRFDECDRAMQKAMAAYGYVDDEFLQSIGAIPESQLGILHAQLVHHVGSIAAEIVAADIVPFDIFRQMWKWYRKGHWPCGWEGNWPDGKLIVF